MLGFDLMQHISARHEVKGVDIGEVDIRSREMRALCSREKPSFVFHLAAYTQVDRAEEEQEIATAINVEGTANVVAACKDRDIPLLLASTDYVFDGKKTVPYLETDEPSPINVYGETKREAEKVVMEELSRWFIVRTSWLFGPHGKNFVETILRLADEREYLEVVDDQRGTPTYTMDLVRALEFFISDTAYGIYHITNSGSCTWFDFAREIVSLTGTGVALRPASSEATGRPARRPAYSVLDTGRFENHFGYRMPPWQHGLERYLEQRKKASEEDAGG